MNGPVIDVLLATYNGERFLREQLDSILTQQNVMPRILAHDDGSTDTTLGILREYAAQDTRVHLLEDGIRLASAKNNFRHLLLASTADYIAFSDQDDVWLPEKLSLELTAMQTLEATHGRQTPLLIYTDLRVVNESLQPITPSLWKSNGLRNAASPTFAAMLMDNVVTGCTMLINRTLATRMQTMPAAAQMHDHWAALLATGIGFAQAIATPTVLYRQHAYNVVGAVQHAPSLPQKLLRFVSREGRSARAAQAELDHAQAAALLQLHADALTNEHRAAAEAFLALPQQTRLARVHSVTKHRLWRPDPQRRLAQFLDLVR